MLLDFSTALATLRGADGLGVFTIMNAARPPADYVYGQFLPETPRPSFQAKSGNMSIRSTMAGISGMDSAYAKVGAVVMTSMSEQTAKITSEVLLSEATQRDMLAILQAGAANNGGTVDQAFLRDEALNFLDKLILQSHLDMSEYLRARAIANGEIDMVYNGIPLTVDYAIPAANRLAQRTLTDRYGGSTSKFWADWHALQAALGYNVRAVIMSPQLFLETISNSVNNIRVQSQDGMNATLVRMINDQGVTSSDARDSMRLIIYNKEGEVYDPANPGRTIKVPFHPKTKMVAIGTGAGNSAYVVGQGGTAAPTGALGYHHLAPTVEGAGRMGRWARLYVPQDRPWQLIGQGVANELPVINMPEHIAIADSLLMV
jgi:hypothetical protein